MTRKIITISFCLFIGWQAQAKHIASVSIKSFATSQNKIQNKKNLCTVQTSETGKLRFIAESYKKAFSKGIHVCFQKQTRIFINAHKRNPSQDDQIRFANTCIDNIQCVPSTNSQKEHLMR